jgi:hypothetical protein
VTSSGNRARLAAVRLAAACVVCTGCGFTTRGVVDNGDGGVDGSGGGSDGNGPPPDAGMVCYGPSGAWGVCLDATPTGALTLPSMIDTDGSELCLKKLPAGWMEAGQPDACFIARDAISTPIFNLQMPSTVDVRGQRPLVLVAHSEITINTPLDVAGHRAENTKPPYLPLECGSFAQMPGNIIGGSGGSGGGGGAGGTFATQGGKGGQGTSTLPGEPGDAVPDPERLRPGCPGQLGGGQNTSDATAGRGGGAVYLVTRGRISILIAINASGGGASHGARNARFGGSGGGSGGMIALYAQDFMVPGTAAVIANGGGGASGGEFQSPGADGNDPSFTTPSTPAGGGHGGGADGGDGYALSGGMPDGTDASSEGAGGGGGGGGAGYIRSNKALGTNRVSPPVHIIP